MGDVVGAEPHPAELKKVHDLIEDNNVADGTGNHA
jgi:hypothetical protein